MTHSDVLTDVFGRIKGIVHRSVGGLSPEQLSIRVNDEGNSIAWLLWHLSRIQDDHVAEVAGLEQVYTAQGWVDRFGLPFGPSATGFGHSPEDVAAVRVESVDLLTGYHDAVHDQTIGYLQGLAGDDLDRIVDESYDPPVSLGIRLVSVISDNLQHAGQAAFVRGLIRAGAHG